MDWRKPFVTLGRVVAVWWQWTVVIVAFFAFIIPFMTPPTEENPTADAGFYAPVVALTVAAMILTQAVQTGGLRIRPIPGIFIGIGSMASAYLWIADEASTHPSNPELPLVLLVTFAAAGVTTISIPILALRSKPKLSDQPDLEPARPEDAG